MAIIIDRSTSGSGRAAPGFNYYSGGMFYGTAPSGWASYTHPLYPSVSIKAKQILSPEAAIAAGITPNTDNTANTWTSTCTIGTAGNNIKITALVPILGATTASVTLCDFALVGSTLSAQLTEIAAAINANTYLTGFSATASSTVLTLIAPSKYGIYFNTTSPYTFTVTGSSPFVFGTATVGVAGTASVYADAYYQISEYFRLNQTGNLWIGFISASSSFKEILPLQLASGNLLRQMWIADTDATRGAAANIAATVTSVQAMALLLSQTAPVEIIYRPNIKAVTDPSTLPNGQTLTNTNNVQVLISQDGDAQGQLLFVESGYSISNLGAKVGTLSASRISSSDAQPVQQNNVSDGIENNVPALSNGTLVSALSISLFQQLFGGTVSNTSGYCYVGFTTYPGNVSGTFWTGNPMFITSTSRYAYMNDNRVWDAVTRIIQQTYIPYLNSEVQFNSDGSISNSSIVYLQSIGVAAITAGMITGINPPYISGTPIVTINPSQPLQQTNVLLISVQIGENGIARVIEVTNGFSN